MIGQGRPASSALALARAALVVCAFLFGRAAAQNTSPAEPTQLRITWGGGDPVRWVGRIRVDDNALSNLKLDSEPDAVGSIWLEEGQLNVKSLSAHKVDSIEIATQLSPTSKLQVDLGQEDKNAPAHLEIPLSELQRHPVQMKLDDRGNTLEIQVAPQPALRIAPSRDPLIFAPGEQCAFELSPTIPNLTPGTDVVIQTTMTPLSPACRKEAPWTESQRLAVPIDGHPKVVINVPLARTEGVYNIHVSASRPSGFDKSWTTLTRLATSTRLAERSFQVVVLDTRPPASAQAPSAQWESVLEIDPTNPRWIERLPVWTQLRRIPGLNHGALGSALAEVKQLPLGRFVELPATPPTGDPHWQGYSLPLEAVGVPHMLEIDYPADVEQHFGISIVEPNANGFVSGANRDASVYVEGLGRSEAKQTQTQRLVFWPRTQAPLLVVSNMHPTATAHFSQIRVFKGGSNQLSAALPNRTISHDRLMAAYFAGPTVAETFGIASLPDSTGGDAPEATYESTTRLADYLRFGGYNSVIFGTKPNAQTHATTASLPELDSTELMLRVFDREGISVIPALDFSAPLEALEPRRRKTTAQTSGLEWVNRNGQSWLEVNGTHRGLAPYYNLLDPRVQQVLLDNVRDMIGRYGRHPAFAGLAIQLSSLGYAQLPSLEWGLDDVTFARFAADTGVQLSVSGEQRFGKRYELLTGEQSKTWQAWRNKQVSGFYGQLAALVRGNTDRRLMLTTENVCADPQIAQGMQPSLNAAGPGSRFAATLSDVGIDREYLEQLPGVVLCPTRYVEPMIALPDRAIDLELNDEFAAWRRPLTPASARAALLYHRPSHQRLASFEMVGRPWRVAGEMQLHAQPLPEGPAVRQPYIEALAEHDPSVIIDGGERLPLGQEDLLREMRSLFAQLPSSAQATEVTKQPVVIRTYAEAGRTTIVAMNLSPWRCNATVSMNLPQATSLEQLTPSAGEVPSNPAAIPAGQQPWTTPLGPYGISAVRVPISGVKVTDVQIVGGGANVELAARLADLKNRDLTAKSDYQLLTNPGFEALPGANPIAGWHLAPNSPNATMQLDNNNPQEGKSCLYLRAGEKGATVESDAFPQPLTGQLAMTVYARGRNLAPGAELRLVVEGDCDGRPFPRAARIPAKDMQRANDQWAEPFLIFVPNLPLQSRGQVRIAFELTGAGEVWLDSVKLSSVLLSFRDNVKADCLELTRRIFVADSALDAGQITDCSRLVDGYWSRFILAYRPPNAPKVAARPATANPAALPPQPNQGQDPAPGFGDRFKRFLPFPR